LDEFAVLAAVFAAEDATEAALFVVVVGANKEFTDIFIPSVT
jgi:hypothetical protein